LLRFDAQKCGRTSGNRAIASNIPAKGSTIQAGSAGA
jgi:hypothetical protein